MSLSKAKIKFIHSLEQKKHRKAEGLFVAEGPKVVGDILEHHKPITVIATQEWTDAISSLSRQKADNLRAAEIITVTNDELARVSFLQHPQQVLAVFRLLTDTPSSVSHTDTWEDADKNDKAGKDAEARTLSLALDGVQDPGNLGTIIRIADWFGIEDIYCSTDTVDVWNPKVVQATMGSIARVRLHYCDLCHFIDTLPEGYPVYGTFLDGENIYKTPLSPYGLIVMGNEGKGISADVRERINRRILIPPFPEGRETAESLNVAIATAITCAEFRRQ